jgi:hypothetical protein
VWRRQSGLKHTTRTLRARAAHAGEEDACVRAIGIAVANAAWWTRPGVLGQAGTGGDAIGRAGGRLRPRAVAPVQVVLQAAAAAAWPPIS